MSNLSPSRSLAIARTPGSFLEPVASGKGFQIGEVITVLRRWWWQCLSLGIVAGAIAVSVVWLTFEPAYEASAYLELLHHSPYVAFAPGGESQAFTQTQIELMRSPVVLNRVIAQPEIASLPEAQESEAPLQWISKNLKAGSRGGSELVEIVFRSREPAAAAKVANAVMDSYLSLHVDRSLAQTDRIIALLRDEKTKRAAEVEQTRERVKTLTQQTSANDDTGASIDRERVIRESPLAKMEDHRAVAEVEEAILQASLAANEEVLQGKKIEIAPAVLEQALESQEEVQLLRQQLSQARLKLRQSELAGAKGRVDPTTRDVQRLEQMLEKTLAGSRPKLMEQLVAAEMATLEQSKADLLAAIENQKLLQKVWTDRIEEQRKKLKELGGESLELEFARNDLDRSELVLQKISDRIVVLSTEKEAPPRAAELQRAPIPQKPVEDVPYKKFGLALLGSLCLPFGLAFLWERHVRRISAAEQVTAEIDLPVLAEVAALPSKALLPAFSSNERVLRERYTFEESVDALRVGLMLAPEMQGLQTLVVTSSISQEGKSSLACSLASSLAKGTHEPTLLIDADLRAPDLNEVFNIPLQPGLVEVLDRSSSLDDAIVESPILGLHVLPAGELNKNPHLILSGCGFPTLLKELRSRYRYIIIDAPPVLLASEALIVASAADGALICTMRDISRGAQLKVARERLAAAGVRLLGAVVNGVPSRVWSQKYGNYGYASRRYVSVQHEATASGESIGYGEPASSSQDE